MSAVPNIGIHRCSGSDLQELRQHARTERDRSGLDSARHAAPNCRL